jgi:hypothetical protein
MPEWFGFLVAYDAPCTPTNVRRVLEATRRAAEGNWSSFRDRLTPSGPATPVDVEGIMQQLPPEGLCPYGSEGRHSVHFHFSYSPASTRPADFTVHCFAEGCLGASLRVYDSVRFESGSDREELLRQAEPDRLIPRREDGSAPPDDFFDPEYEGWWGDWDAPLAEDLWPRNRAFLVHIRDRLLEALPVNYVKTDPELEPTP